MLHLAPAHATTNPTGTPARGFPGRRGSSRARLLAAVAALSLAIPAGAFVYDAVADDDAAPIAKKGSFDLTKKGSFDIT